MRPFPHPVYAAAGDPTGGDDDAGNDDVSNQGGQQDSQNDGGGAAGDGGEKPGAGAGGAQAGEQSGTGEGEGSKGKQTQDWRDKQIAKLHRQKKERDDAIADRDRRLAELEAKLAAGSGAAATHGEANTGGGGQADRTNAAGGDGNKAPAGRTQAEIDAEIDRRASEKAQASQMKRDMAALFERGSEKFTKDKFTTALSNLESLEFPASDVMDVLSTDDPEKVLYTLGSNPEEAQRIMALPDGKRRTEYVKIALGAKDQVRRPSGAPAPIEPVGNRNVADLTELADDLPEDEWRRRRLAQKSKSQGRPWSPGRRVG